MPTSEQKIAVVLGASSGSGFGGAIARRLNTAGYRVVVSGRRRAPLETLAADLNGDAVTCDITVEDQLAALAGYCIDQHGRLDAAVNAAGIMHASPLRKLKAADIAAVCQVHFAGSLLFIKHMADAMMRGAGAGGSIVTISSLTATLPGEGLALYAGTKAGVDHAVRVAALEYGPHSIRVNSLSPGMTRTPLTESFFDHLAGKFAAETPLGRVGTVDDAAGAAAWLLSDDCFATGQNVQCNGGASLRRLPTPAELAG